MMSVTTTPNLTVGPGVSDFLRRNNAEASFQTACDLIREYFPETLSVEAELQEDHDEPGWRRVRLLFTLPSACPLERVLEQQRLFQEQFLEQVPFAQVPLFLALDTFTPE
jgi:hypothetical protein